MRESARAYRQGCYTGGYTGGDGVLNSERDRYDVAGRIELCWGWHVPGTCNVEIEHTNTQLILVALNV